MVSLAYMLLKPLFDTPKEEPKKKIIVKEVKSEPIKPIETPKIVEPVLP